MAVVNNINNINDILKIKFGTLPVIKKLKIENFLLHGKPRSLPKIIQDIFSRKLKVELPSIRPSQNDVFSGSPINVDRLTALAMVFVNRD